MSSQTIAEFAKDKDCIFVSGKDIMFPDVVVQTSHKGLEKLLDESKDDARSVFPVVWKAIKNVNVDALYNAGGEPWQDFMDDILIMYACRFHLFGMPIPVLYKTDRVMKGAAKLKGPKGRL